MIIKKQEGMFSLFIYLTFYVRKSYERLQHKMQQTASLWQLTSDSFPLCHKYVNTNHIFFFFLNHPGMKLTFF